MGNYKPKRKPAKKQKAAPAKAPANPYLIERTREIIAAPEEPNPNDPLGRVEKESEDAYRAFVVWVGLGPSRTYRQAAEMTGYNQANFTQWASRYQWQNRLKAYAESAKTEALAALDEQRHIEARKIAAEYDELVATARRHLEESRSDDKPGGDANFLKVWLEALRDKRRMYGLDYLPLIGPQQDGSKTVTTAMVLAYRQVVEQRGVPALDEIERTILEAEGEEKDAD